MRLRTVICVLLSVASGIAVAAETPGLVKEKPSSGRFVKVDDGYMIPYEVKIPGTEVSFWMEPIPGGEFTMGSPEDEAGREETEGPQRKITVDPYWMARHEVTWAEYKIFMDLYDAFKAFEVAKIRTVTEDNKVDAITAPTVLYEPDFTFEYGADPKQPAVTVTQYACKQYSKWLSAITECQFRLPTEAEWEYACRAGTSTAYHFGNDASKLGDYAWYVDNTDDEGTKNVGQKKPNPWGLYDMHGNAAEWVIDYLQPYKTADGMLNAAKDWVRPEEVDPRAIRGGSWEFEAEECRCASRLGSDSEEWRTTDPNLPKSPWWFTDDPARGVGFRLVRNLKTVPRKEIAAFWEIDHEDIQYGVDDRLHSDGRGVQGIVDKDLPAAIKKIEDE